MKKGSGWWLVFLVITMNTSMLWGAQQSVVVLQANESSPYWSKKLPNGGMCGEIVEAISKEMGIKTRIEFLPLKRIIEDTKGNPVGNPLFYMENQDFAAIIPIAVSYNAFFSYRQGEKSPPSPTTESTTKRIGVLRGAISNPQEFTSFGQFEESYTRESLFKKLQLGRLDRVLELNLVGRETIRKLFPNEVDHFDAEILPDTAAPIAIMISSSYPEGAGIGARYAQGLHRIIKNGVHRKIMEKYYGEKKIPASWYSELSKFERIYSMSSGGNGL